MSASAMSKSGGLKAVNVKIAASTQDARNWRRFLHNAPPLDDLIEIRRLHDNKTILRRRSDLPPSFLPGSAEWRPV